jgi:hypothetical protein
MCLTAVYNNNHAILDTAKRPDSSLFPTKYRRGRRVSTCLTVKHRVQISLLRITHLMLLLLQNLWLLQI